MSTSTRVPERWDGSNRSGRCSPSGRAIAPSAAKAIIDGAIRPGRTTGSAESAGSDPVTRPEAVPACRGCLEGSSRA
jgi:hypothetical protein